MMVITVVLISILHAALASGCPTCYLKAVGQCECGDETSAFVALCSQGEESIGIHGGYCVTFDYDKRFMLVGKCPYLYTTNMTNRIQSALPDDPTLINEAICGSYNRQGLLCGLKCIKRFSPAGCLLHRLALC